MATYTVEQLEAIIAEITSTIFEAEDKNYPADVIDSLNYELRKYRKAMKKAKGNA
jgi:phage tail sheath protein FI